MLFWWTPPQGEVGVRYLSQRLFLRGCCWWTPPQREVGVRYSVHSDGGVRHLWWTPPQREVGVRLPIEGFSKIFPDLVDPSTKGSRGTLLRTLALAHLQTLVDPSTKMEL